jgi:hypothetical protein
MSTKIECKDTVYFFIIMYINLFLFHNTEKFVFSHSLLLSLLPEYTVAVLYDISIRKERFLKLSSLKIF